MKKALKSCSTIPIAVWYPWGSFTIQREMGSYIIDIENCASFALRHPNRIREIDLCLTNSMLLKIRTQILASFPTLEYLWLRSTYQNVSEASLPDGFLGGSAPRLRCIRLSGVAFPTLPLLLSSTRDLLILQLDAVSRSGYFSPESLASSLSMMTQLKFLRIYFLPLASKETGSAGRPLGRRANLPALSEFNFSGDRTYLEDLISRIDSPILEQSFTPSASETRQLSQFTSHPIPHVLAQQPSIILGDNIFFMNQFCTSSIAIDHATLYLTYEGINLNSTPHIQTTLCEAL